MQKTLTESHVYHTTPTDLILEAYEQGAVPEQFVFDLCMLLYFYGELGLNRVQERNTVLWSKLKQEAKDRFGDYDFTADSDRDRGRMFVEAASEGFFPERFIGELCFGLREFAEHGTGPEGYRTCARNILDGIAPARKDLESSQTGL